MTEVPQAEEIVANAEPLNLEDIIEIISDEVAKGFAKDMGIWHDIRNGERDASFFLKVHPLPFGRMSEDAKHFVPLAFGDNSKVRATVGSSFEDLSRKALQGDSIIRKNIAEEIIHDAIAAAIEDYRFGSIQEKELSSLSYTVYILSEPELVKNLKELNPKKYGIIVKTMPITHPDGTDVVFNGHLPYKSGLLLPDLEGVDTIEKQISIACQKGGIDPSREKILIYKFTVKKYQ